MKCVDKKYIALSPVDQMRSYEFEEFEHIPTKTNYNLIYTGPHFTVFDVYDNIVLLWFEEPNCLIIPEQHQKLVDQLPKLNKILTICPFCADCFNKMYNTNKWQWVFYPFNKKYIPPATEKIYDVYYTGNAFSPVCDVYYIMEKFKSCFVCSNYGEHQGVDYPTKLSLNSKSKISIIHNVLRWWPPRYNNVVDQYPDLKSLDQVKEHGILPQMKSRTVEAAACKSLMLVRHDYWNMIESYFEPDIDFVYWYDAEDLEEKINYILYYYDEYLPMIEHAYNTLIENYSTQKFFDMYLKGL